MRVNRILIAFLSMLCLAGIVYTACTMPAKAEVFLGTATAAISAGDGSAVPAAPASYNPNPGGSSASGDGGASGGDFP